MCINITIWLLITWHSVISMGSLPHLACRLNCTQLMMQLFNIYFYFRCLMSEYLPHPFAAISKIMVNRHGKPWSLSHSLPLLFCLLKLKFAVLHWCKCKFLMFTSNKSKVFTCVNTVWPRVKADQKMPYYFCIRVLLRTVPHWVSLDKPLSSLKPVSWDSIYRLSWCYS